MSDPQYAIATLANVIEAAVENLPDYQARVVEAKKHVPNDILTAIEAYRVSGIKIRPLTKDDHISIARRWLTS
jgi:hypothetical protein